MLIYPHCSMQGHSTNVGFDHTTVLIAPVSYDLVKFDVLFFAIIDIVRLARMFYVLTRCRIAVVA